MFSLLTVTYIVLCVDFLALVWWAGLRKQEIERPETSKKLPNSYKDFVALRSSKETMELFIKEILSCIVGRHRMTVESSQRKISEFATVTDEAFGLLVLEHIWDVWTTKDVNDYYKRKSEVKVEEDHGIRTVNGEERAALSADAPKKTATKKQAPGAGKFTEDYHKAGRCKGWNVEGLKRFNELCKKVREDRAANAAFEDQYLADMREQEELRYLTKKRRRSGDRPVEVEDVIPENDFD